MRFHESRLYMLAAVLSLALLFSQYILPDWIFSFKNPACSPEIDNLFDKEEAVQSQGCHLDGMQISQKVINSSEIKNSQFPRAVFNGVEFRFSKWQNVNMESSDLRGIRFQRSQFENVNFEKSNLKNSFFFLSDFKDCQFRGADLSNATVYLTSFHGSTFDQTTKLPFTFAEALRRGMKFEN